MAAAVQDEGLLLELFLICRWENARGGRIQGCGRCCLCHDQSEYLYVYTRLYACICITEHVYIYIHTFGYLTHISLYPVSTEGCRNHQAIPIHPKTLNSRSRCMLSWLPRVWKQNSNYSLRDSTAFEAP